MLIISQIILPRFQMISLRTYRTQLTIYTNKFIYARISLDVAEFTQHVISPSSQFPRRFVADLIRKTHESAVRSIRRPGSALKRATDEDNNERLCNRRNESDRAKEHNARSVLP